MGSKGSTSTSSSAPPKEVLEEYKNVVNRANQVADLPLNQYTGATLAGFSPMQNAAFQNINNAQGAYQPYFNAASGLINQGTQQYTPMAYNAENLQQFQNPYTQNVINSTMANMDIENAKAQQGLTSNAIAKGAWGGDRSGLVKNDLARQQALANGQVIAGLENQGFQNAQNQFNTQNQMGLQSAGLNSQNAFTGAGQYGALGTNALNNTLNAANAQYGAGEAQQNLEQNALNIPYQMFQQQQQYPFQTTQWLSNIAQGIGGQMGMNQTSTQPSGNGLSSIIGTGLGIAGLFMADGGAVGYADGGVPDMNFSIVPQTDSHPSAAISYPSPPQVQKDDSSDKLLSVGAGLYKDRHGKDAAINKDLNAAIAGDPAAFGTNASQNVNQGFFQNLANKIPHGNPVNRDAFMGEPRMASGVGSYLDTAMQSNPDVFGSQGGIGSVIKGIFGWANGGAVEGYDVGGGVGMPSIPMAPTPVYADLGMSSPWANTKAPGTMFQDMNYNPITSGTPVYAFNPPQMGVNSVAIPTLGSTLNPETPQATTTRQRGPKQPHTGGGHNRMADGGIPAPPWDLKAQEMAESGGNDFAIGPMTKYGQAKGPMQVLDSTGSDPGYGVAPMKDNSPEENRRFGREYGAAMAKEFGGDSVLGLMAYNWGPGNVHKWLDNGADISKVPAATRKYVNDITGLDIGSGNVDTAGGFLNANASAIADGMDARDTQNVAQKMAGLSPSSMPPQFAQAQQTGISGQPQVQSDAIDELRKDLDENAPSLDKGLALSQAGFAMAAGKSPFALQNIGAGAVEGLKTYADQKKRVQDYKLKEAEALRRAKVLLKGSGRGQTLQIFDQMEALNNPEGDPIKSERNLMLAGKFQEKGMTIDDKGNTIVSPGADTAAQQMAGAKERGKKNEDIAAAFPESQQKNAGEKAGEYKQNFLNNYPKVIANGNTMLRELDSFKSDPGLASSVGFLGKIPNVWPAGDRARFFSKLDKLMGEQFLQAYETLKGGGQITEIEGTKATNAMSRLQNRDLNVDDYKEAIEDLKSVLKSGMERANKQYEQFNKDLGTKSIAPDVPATDIMKKYPDAKQAPDGNWYVQKDGKWHRIKM